MTLTIKIDSPCKIRFPQPSCVTKFSDTVICSVSKPSLNAKFSQVYLNSGKRSGKSFFQKLMKISENLNNSEEYKQMSRKAQTGLLIGLLKNEMGII